ncbi:MAG: phosphatase [Alphaproteobacteria bacterium]
MRATRALHKRILLTFDFDLTLAPATIDTLLEVLGIEREAWQRERVDPLIGDGWDQILAHGFALIEAARAVGRPLDSAVIRETAARIKPFPGVPEMFDRLRAVAGEIADDIALEFTILSAGFVDIIIDTELAKKFDNIWASQFHFNDDGVVTFVKRTITHPEKVLYLEALGKGLGPAGPNAPDSAVPVEGSERHAPIDQMIYVGDGASDLQAFRFIEENGGYAIAIAKDDGTFAAQKKMQPDQRVENVAPPDFSGGSELLRSLTLAVKSAAARIELRRLGQEK